MFRKLVKKKEIEDRIKEILSEKRFRHSLGVAKLAQELAEIHSVDPEKAYLAGLLHDVLREKSEEELRKIAGKEDLNLEGIKKSIINKPAKHLYRQGER